MQGDTHRVFGPKSECGEKIQPGAPHIGISSVRLQSTRGPAQSAFVQFPVRRAHLVATGGVSLSADAGSGDDGGFVLLALVWQRFVDGTLTVVDAFSSKERCYLLVEAREPERAPDPEDRSRRDFAILQRALSGEMQKVVAYELERSGSAVSHAAASALRLLGLELSARRAPMLLILCACADACGSTTAAARISSLDGDPGARFLISVERPDRRLPDVLSPAEGDVVRGIVDGLTNVAIAGGLKSSRTVANQIASVFKKLGVGSRAELLCRLALSALDAAEKTGTPDHATAPLWLNLPAAPHEKAETESNEDGAERTTASLDGSAATPA